MGSTPLEGLVGRSKAHKKIRSYWGDREKKKNHTKKQVVKSNVKMHVKH